MVHVSTYPGNPFWYLCVFEPHPKEPKPPKLERSDRRHFCQARLASSCALRCSSTRWQASIGGKSSPLGGRGPVQSKGWSLKPWTNMVVFNIGFHSLNTSVFASLSDKSYDRTISNSWESMLAAQGRLRLSPPESAPNRFGFPPGLAMPHLPQGQNGPRPRDATKPDATEGRPKDWDSPRGVLSRGKERIKNCPVVMESL